MLPHRFFFALLLCTYAHSQVFSPGTTLERVQSELGPAESIEEVGSKEVLVYSDGTRLEFIDGKLISAGNSFNSSDPQSKKDSRVADDPLVKAESIVEQRQQQTISASTKSKPVDYSLLAENYGNRKTLEDEIRAEDAASAGAAPARQRLRAIMLACGIEFIATFVVLILAFQICGFSSALWRQLFISGAVALTGALLDVLLQAGPLHPIRLAAGFVILLIALPQFTQLRRWTTAIKIAVIARIVFILFGWLGLYGIAGLLNI